MSVDTAIELYNKGEYKQAIDAFSVVLEQCPENAELYNNIALCYANLGDNDRAEKNYLRAQELNPKLAQVYINLADIYYRNKDMASGVGLMTVGVSELPDNMVLRHYLARFYMEDAKLDLAVDELENILEKQPDNYDVYYDLGKVHFELGNYACAIENFENVLEYKNENPWIYYYLGEAYEANDEIDKAISNFLKAIAHNEVFSPAYKKVAILFMARGDYEDAIEYFEDYAELDIPKEEATKVKELIERIKKKQNG
jgi:tetratricopeptide (TPR) repeat protein